MIVFSVELTLRRFFTSFYILHPNNCIHGVLTHCWDLFFYLSLYLFSLSLSLSYTLAVFDCSVRSEMTLYAVSQRKSNWKVTSELQRSNCGIFRSRYSSLSVICMPEQSAACQWCICLNRHSRLLVRSLCVWVQSESWTRCTSLYWGWSSQLNLRRSSLFHLWISPLLTIELSEHVLSVWLSPLLTIELSKHVLSVTGCAPFLQWCCWDSAVKRFNFVGWCSNPFFWQLLCG